MREPPVGTPTCASADAVRAELARAALGLTPRPQDASVGSLALHPHQRHAVARLRYALHHYRIALLADDVGLGKTAVALALLRETADAIVVAPAALRAHWTAALDTAALTSQFVTTESLGRGSGLGAAPARLIVVDEAHHFRNRATHRWQQLATLAGDARVLLLSATPVHNRPRDLAALFRLTLGDHARTLDARTLARLVVRRSATDVEARPREDAPAVTVLGDRPRVAPTRWIELPDAPALLDALQTLPPAPTPQDGTATPDLDRYTLARLSTSSDAALTAALQRRRTRALTVVDALRDGLPPTRADVRTLTRGITTDPTTQQLSLLTAASESATPPTCVRHDEVRDVVERYVDAVQRVRDLVRATDSDARRLAALRSIRARHPDAQIVAFSWSADTVRALYRALARDGRVAMLTGSGGRIASGALSRADVLARFAPCGQSCPPPIAIERITLLFTTDVLSEGLDLRDASVVVHLDLPWTPARLAQRTGRAVRPGTPASVVHVYAFRPSPMAAAALRLSAHIEAKRRAAGLTVGISPIEAMLTLDPSGANPPQARAPTYLARDRLLERWDAMCPPPSAHQRSARHRYTAAALRCGTSGFIAVVALPGSLGALRIPMLVAAADGGAPTTAAATVRRALAIAARASRTAEPPIAGVHDARRQLARWARRCAVRAALVETRSIVRDDEHGTASVENAALLARAARALHAAAPVDRAALAACATAIRNALAHPVSAHHASTIRDAAPAGAGDAEWLVAAGRAVSQAASRGTERPRRAGEQRPANHGPRVAARPTLRALVLLIA